MCLVFRLAAVWLCIVPAYGLYASDSVSSFVDAYEKAINSRASITARVSCKYYNSHGQVLPVEINGIVTWGGFAEPFSVMTLRREEQLVDRSEAYTIVLSSKGDRIRIADSGSGFYYDERATGVGSELVSSRLDDLFLLLMYPSLIDGLRMDSGTVTESSAGDLRFLHATVDSGSGRMLFVVESATYLPVSIERNGVDSNGRPIRAELTFSALHTSARLPPASLFDVNLVFGFPRHVYDPYGLFALTSVPDFEADMLDGKIFSLKAKRGKSVFLCFRNAGEAIGFSTDIYLDKAGDMARKRGGIFIDVYPSVSRGGDSIGNRYSAANTCRNDVLARCFKINSDRTPCVILITPKGGVGGILAGYIPGLSERAIDSLLDTCLPPLETLDAGGDAK